MNVGALFPGFGQSSVAAASPCLHNTQDIEAALFDKEKEDDAVSFTSSHSNASSGFTPISRQRAAKNR